MEPLEQVQHDFGEGPCLLAYAEDRVVAVEDLGSELVWDRLAAVVGQLQVRGVLSVPVRLASQPVGTLDVYATQPRVWTPTEVEALGALAVVTAELVSTGVELANREVEVAQLRRALASRIWIEQAKGVLAVTRGISPDAAFQQLRKQARSSSRKVADLAQEVVQEAQRERIAALAVDDARVRAAEARAREAEQALQAAQTGLARRTAALDRAQTTSTSATEPLTNATTSPTNATGRPANPGSAVADRSGWARRSQGNPRCSNGRVWRSDFKPPKYRAFLIAATDPFDREPKCSASSVG